MSRLPFLREENSNHAKNGAHIKALKKASELQKKIERQRDASRKTQNLAIDQQPKRSFLARNRSTVSKNDSSGPFNQDQQPLVAIMSDDSSEDDFTSHLSKTAHKEITEQLIKDGFNLDLEPDDEDLDLIPPRPMNERCVCCNMHSNCALQ
ncbi:protein FAM219A isoform X2 [Octopus sinensis]|uniref:Protein FAM219A isoform X2 n=1 Tax=Octopus sinensis TaxID=2607531 RepID=A0A7E6FPH9_9MOLL|nr:protein FAM219A isoform X2 [Octopus sinensis]